MNELVIVGRGGEGVVLASQVLADTFARAGAFVQAFPEFTAERRGAPISAFVRWDESRPIRRRYKIGSCDVLAVLSPSPPEAAVLRRVRSGGLVVVNRPTRLPLAGPFRVARVPASGIAREHGILSAEGRPIGNAAVLGACVRLLLPDGLGALEEAIAARMALPDENIAAAREGFARCTTQRAAAADTRIEPVAPVVPPPTPRFPVSTTDSRGRSTGLWALEQPLFGEACTACALCALFCPEAAITRRDGTMVVDLRYCKGCGICETVCPVRNAVRLAEAAA